MMKKLIFILLLLITVDLSVAAFVPRPHINPAIYNTAHRRHRHSHSTEAVAIDDSLQTSLIRKDYHFHCKQCDKDFVIHDMLYHENTDMYFYYKQSGSLKVLQPYEGRKICCSCCNKQFLTIIGFVLIIALLGGFIVYYFNRD